MKNKIVIGSIIAAFLLVLVSFTSVIGFQSSRTKSALQSPLFRIRTQMALDTESKEIICDYIGKGEEGILSIPTRNDKTELIQKFIDKIQKMDDATFNRFITYIVNYKQKNQKMSDSNIKDFVRALHFIRNNNQLGDYAIYIKDRPITEGGLCTFGGGWEPGCVFLFFIICFTMFAIFMTIFIDFLKCMLFNSSN
jgi:hypothetical protein